MAEAQDKERQKGGKRSGDAEEEKEARYGADEILANPRRLAGASRRVVAGALAASNRETHTESQAREAVERFLRREVKSEAVAE